jgi:ATP/maltotriose-dependent transcriptional regulator MalT
MAELIEEGTNPRRQAFIMAAGEFLECASVTYQQSDKQRKVCGRRASDVFYDSGYFTFAAQHARKAKAYDRALEIVQTCPVDDEVTKTINSVCQVIF